MRKQQSDWISFRLVVTNAFEIVKQITSIKLPHFAHDQNMQEQPHIRTIKVQPQLQEPLFYQPEDIVIGKCIDQPPWPAVVKSFMGYDEDQVQVFHVSFLGDKSSANLETYLLTPLTERYIKKLKSRYTRHSRIYHALGIAQNKLKQLFESSKDIPAKYERFMRLYQPEKEIDAVMSEDVERFSYDKSSMHGGLRNRELMPMIEKYYVDSDGNKRKSKEYVKRRLGFGVEVVAIGVEIQEAERRGKQEYVITKICEGHVVNILMSKRAFDKHSNKKLVKPVHQTKQSLQDITFHPQHQPLPPKRPSKSQAQLLQIHQTLLVSL